MTMQEHEEKVRFRSRRRDARRHARHAGARTGIVLFAHGSGSSRHSPRNCFVAATLLKARLGTLFFDLLAGDEEAGDLA